MGLTIKLRNALIGGILGLAIGAFAADVFTRNITSDGASFLLIFCSYLLAPVVGIYLGFTFDNDN